MVRSVKTVMLWQSVRFCRETGIERLEGCAKMRQSQGIFEERRSGAWQRCVPGGMRAVHQSSPVPSARRRVPCAVPRPKMPTVRSGSWAWHAGPRRGTADAAHEGVEIAAICDKRKSCTDKVEQMLRVPASRSGGLHDGRTRMEADVPAGGPDLIYIAPRGTAHAMAVYRWKTESTPPRKSPRPPTLENLAVGLNL